MNQAVIDWLIAQGWNLLSLVAGLILSALGVYGIRWLRAQAAIAESDKHATIRREVFQVIRDGVYFAEQKLKSNPEKLQAVLQIVQDYLDRRGYHFPVAETVAMIESSVFTDLDHTDAPASSVAPAPSEAAVTVTTGTTSTHPGAILPVAAPKA